MTPVKADAPKVLPDQSKEIAANKEKAANFVRLATDRTNKAVNMIDLIGKLANTSQYSYTPEQVAKIVQALNDATNRVQRKFANPKEAPKGSFSL